MPLIRKGACNHCGKCCLREGGVISENPCISLSEDRCKFYRDGVGPELYGHCLILGRGAKPITTVKDRFGNKITDAQIAWFEQNCASYPVAKDAEAGVYPPHGCSFTFEVVVIDG